MPKLISTRRSFALLCALALGAVISHTAQAEPRPADAVDADPKQIYAAFTNQTWTWNKGASFWGRGGAFQAFNNQAFGEGAWYVTTKGTLCYDAKWSWRDDADGQVKSRDIKNCWAHAVTPDGALWQRAHDKEEWYRFDVKEKVSRGNKVRGDVNRLKRSIGS